MNKEEILKRSRSEKYDEGMLYAENQGNKYGFIIFCIIFVIIVLFNFFTGQSNHSVFSMFWAVSGTQSYLKYKFSKSKSFLISFVCSTTASILFLILFILERML